MSFERKYVYGIIEECEPRRFNFSGVMNAEVFAVNHQQLATVVSDIELEEIDPTLANVRAHTLVQDKLLTKYTLLPMVFGMIADNKDDVLKLMEKNYHGAIGELERLAGKVEIEVKVFWDMETMIKELQGGNEELTKLKTRISNATSPIEVQRLLMEAGKMVEHIALDWKAKYADRVYAVLKGLAVDARLNNPLGVKNILNASFLVEKAAENDFKREVYRLDSQYQGKVNFKYVGPMASYNFVSLKLEPAN